MTLEKLLADTQKKRAQEIKSHLEHANRSAAELMKLLNVSDEELMRLQQAALVSDPQEIATATEAALTAFADQLHVLQQNAEPAAQQVTLQIMLEFVHVLADLVPSVLAKVREHGLQFVTVHDLQTDPTKRANFDNLYQTIVHPQDTQDINLAIVDCLQNAMRQASDECEVHTKRLKNFLANNKHLQSVTDEHADLTKKAAIAGGDNAMFDPLRRLGHLLAMLLHMRFIVPYELENYPRAFKHDPEKDNLFAKVNNDRFGLASDNRMQDYTPTQAGQSTGSAPPPILRPGALGQ